MTSADALLVAGQAALGDAAHVFSSPPVLLDAYERPEDGRRARTYVTNVIVR